MRLPRPRDDEPARAFAIAAARIDLLVTDIVMPEMSGPELARLVRQTDSRVGLLFLSGYVDTPTLEGITADPSALFTRKQVSVATLASGVRKAPRPKYQKGTAMKILTADDDAASLNLLGKLLRHWGHEVVEACDGAEAAELLEQPDAPRLLLLDWMMPRLDGVSLCRRLRESETHRSSYIVLLTAVTGIDRLTEALEAGVDDYVTKPFEPAELRARILAGVRVTTLQQQLATRVAELESAHASVRELEGLLPICMYCKRIRDDQHYWHKIESYIGSRTRVQFSHGICPACDEQVVQPMLEREGIDEPQARTGSASLPRTDTSDATQEERPRLSETS